MPSIPSGILKQVFKGSRSGSSRSVGSSQYDEDLDLVMSGGRPMKGDDDDMPDEVDNILREGVDEVGVNGCCAHVHAFSDQCTMRMLCA